MTHYLRQGKVRVTDGQCLQTDRQSLTVVLQLNRDGSQRSTGDARLTITSVNCASCNAALSNLSRIDTVNVTHNRLTKPEIAKIIKCTSIWTRASLL